MHGVRTALIACDTANKMSTKVQNYDIDIDSDNCTATTYFPGITYDDFDRAGCICPRKLSRIFEAGRRIPLSHCNFLNYKDLVSTKYGFFVLGGDYHFNSCLWELPHRVNYFPYRIELELVEFGQTSWTLRHSLINSLDNKEVASYIGKIVRVDKRTRRSESLPGWFKEKYSVKDSRREKVDIDFSDWSVPRSAYKFKTFVKASETDDYGHMNQAEYIRLCMDAAASATAKGKNSFSRLTHDICLYPILKMTTAYRSESVMGDELVTSVWEDDLSPQILHFAIHSGNRLAFTSSITFRTVPSSKL